MIDAHAHLSDYRLAPIIDRLVAGLKSRGLRQLIMGGVDLDDWHRQRNLVARYPDFLIAAFGIHPWTVRDRSPEELAEMFTLLQVDFADARFLGEIGIDFFGLIDQSRRQKQETWCLRQLDFAVKTRKPVVLHVVRGHDRMLSLLRQVSGVRGFVHGFRGPPEIGIQYVELGLTLSFNQRSFRHDQPAQWSWLRGTSVVVESDEPLLKQPVGDVESIADRWIQGLRSATDFLRAAGAIIDDPLKIR
jgi:TatD DNase family protein